MMDERMVKITKDQATAVRSSVIRSRKRWNNNLDLAVLINK